MKPTDRKLIDAILKIRGKQSEDHILVGKMCIRDSLIRSQLHNRRKENGKLNRNKNNAGNHGC